MSETEETICKSCNLEFKTKSLLINHTRTKEHKLASGKCIYTPDGIFMKKCAWESCFMARFVKECQFIEDILTPGVTYQYVMMKWKCEKETIDNRLIFLKSKDVTMCKLCNIYFYQKRKSNHDMSELHQINLKQKCDLESY